MTSIKKICQENNIKAGSLSGIGASNSLSVSFYSEKEKGYVEKSFQGSYEITSVVGNISPPTASCWSISVSLLVLVI